MLIRTVTFAATSAAILAASVVSAQTASTTIIGCVYQEKDVPGRAPNPAERAGLLEDYILAEITPAEAAKPTGTAARQAFRQPTRCTSSSGQRTAN